MLKSLRPITYKDINKYTVRGQYAAGVVQVDVRDRHVREIVRPDAEACENILKQVLECTTLDAVQKVKDNWRPRMEKLPEKRWSKLMTDIGKHETAIYEAEKTA